MKTKSLIQISGHQKISPESILMLKADANYTRIFLVNGKCILSSTTMGKIEKSLKGFQFFRPNRSVILNLEFMADYENKAQSGSYGNILLKNNEKIALSRRKSKAFLKIIQ